MTDAAAEPEVLCERRGAAGMIVLNRPRALNAVTHGMVQAIASALDAWENDPAVTRVVVTGAGDRAFCAGGDIRQLYELGKAGRHAEALAFWREEYILNARIKRYSKPYVAVVDGIVMGGGVGLSLHGSHRIAGDRYLFAMPEVGIGFFPDVGATYALPRLPGHAGLWLGLTGARIRRADAVALGLATHAVPSGALAGLVDALVAGEPVDAAIAAAATDPGPAPWGTDRAVIDHTFAADDIDAILAALDADGSPFAAEVAATMRTKSPTSMVLALHQLRSGASLGFEEAMNLEFRIVSRMVETADFYEGVRAVVVDKDQAPRWSPAAVSDVTPGMIDRYFAPLAEELGLGRVAA